MADGVLIKSILEKIDWKKAIDMILDIVEDRKDNNTKTKWACKIIRFALSIPDND